MIAPSASNRYAEGNEDPTQTEDDTSRLVSGCREGTEVEPSPLPLPPSPPTELELHDSIYQPAPSRPCTPHPCTPSPSTAVTSLQRPRSASTILKRGGHTSTNKIDFTPPRPRSHSDGQLQFQSLYSVPCESQSSESQGSESGETVASGYCGAVIQEEDEEYLAKLLAEQAKRSSRTYSTMMELGSRVWSEEYRRELRPTWTMPTSHPSHRGTYLHRHPSSRHVEHLACPMSSDDWLRLLRGREAMVGITQRHLTTLLRLCLGFRVNRLYRHTSMPGGLHLLLNYMKRCVDSNHRFRLDEWECYVTQLQLIHGVPLPERIDV